MNNWRKITLALFSGYLFVSGCAPSLENLKDADTTMPDSFGVSTTAPAESPPAENASKDTTAETKPIATDHSGKVLWKDFFKDQNLAELVEAGLSKNQELAIVEQEIQVAQNEIRSREGEYLPKLGLRAGAGIDKLGKYSSQGASDEATGTPDPLQNYTLGLFASWELDVWKKLRNATKSALYQYLATVDGKNYMVTRLVAEIARAYYELLSLHKKVAILEQNIQIQTQALEIVRLQKQAARVTELAVKRFEAEVLKSQSRQYGLKQQIIEKENELNFLTGRFPQHIQVPEVDFIAIVPQSIQAGVPSKLLENRPDVRQAEFGLKAAKLDVDVARARFYPAFSIEAGTGFQSFNTKHLFTTPDSLVYNLAANLTVPLLNRKAIRADYFSAGAKQLQAVYNFERTILKAFTEVTNQLNMVENLKGTFDLKAQQVKALDASVLISNTLFSAARCDYMEVLLTRRDALEAQMELVEVKEQQLTAVVNLYKALGGGWQRQQLEGEE